MKEITFKRISIKNFLSIGNDPVEIDFNSGINIITGFNRDEADIKNGCGKSTILDAFYFVIFGTTMRELSKLSFIVNRKVGKNCKVILDFDIYDNKDKCSYSIERTLAPQSLKIWQNGIDITKSTTQETNRYILDILSANKDIFQNCILMRANNVTPFMLKRKQERKTFIESIFNLNVFSDMLKVLKDEIRTVKNEYTLNQNSLSIHEKNIIDYKKQYEILLEEHEKRVLANKTDLKNLKQKIEEENTILESKNKDLTLLKNTNNNDLEKIKNNFDICNENIKKLNDIKYKLDIDCSVITRDIEKLNNSPHVCPTCLREYPEEYLENIKNQCLSLKDKYNNLAKKLSALNEKIEECKVKKEKYESKLRDYELLINKAKLLSNEILQHKKILSFYINEFNEKSKIIEKPAVDNFIDLIKNANEEVENIKEKITAVEKNLNKMTACEHILGEYGVRAYVVNRLLELFNSRLAYYLASTRSMFNFKFNEYFEEEITDSNGIICMYNNCSGAEMKKIDIAISFALRDMLNIQHQVSYNILFFDEILDSSLDDKSLSIILDFISELSYKENKAVYIISHKNNIQIANVNETITLEKINGFTRKLYV